MSLSFLSVNDIFIQNYCHHLSGNNDRAKNKHERNRRCPAVRILIINKIYIIAVYHKFMIYKNYNKTFLMSRDIFGGNLIAEILKITGKFSPDDLTYKLIIFGL